MNRYAMLINNVVIQVVDSETPPDWPPDPNGNPVTALEIPPRRGGGVKAYMHYSPDTGEFFWPPENDLDYQKEAE